MTIPTHLLESKLITNKEWDEYQELKKMVYDPEDMTLLFMYCSEKTKDRIKILHQENKQLKELYRKTCEHLFNIGNDELARYFQAQINECPTFTTQILGDKE